MYKVIKKRFTPKCLCFCVSLALLILVVFSSMSSANQVDIDYVSAWLRMVDSQQYDQAWQWLAPEFKEEYPQERWEEILISDRAPHGNLISRVVVLADKTRHPSSDPRSKATFHQRIVFHTTLEDDMQIFEVIFFRVEKSKRLITLYRINQIS